jgi:hypothetical protein
MSDERKKSNTTDPLPGGVPKPFPSLEEKAGHVKAQNIYALLVGIDRYDFFVDQPGDLNLNGCVRDSLEIERYLKETVQNPKERLHLRKLRSHLKNRPPAETPIDVDCAIDEEFEATRKHFLSSMLEFLQQAEEGDIVFIHYSGHGSTQSRPKALAHIDLNADGKSETIICCDSYVEEHGKRIPPIRDLEMRWMISQIASTNPHIVFISDCCNSSGNSRFLGSSIKVRTTETPDKAESRMIEDFVFYQKDEAIRALLDGENPEQFQIPPGRHVAIAACHSYELAKELKYPEGTFGVLTYHLLKTLRATKANISYRDLTKLLKAKASADVNNQSPQSYSPFTPDLDLKFMGGITTNDEPYYLVRPGSDDKTCVIDAGSLHGIYPVSEGKTWVALYPADANVSATDPETAISAFFTTIHPHESVLELADDIFPADTEFMKAVITASPAPKTKVCLLAEVDEQLIDMLNPEDELEQQLEMGMQLLQDKLKDNLFLDLVERPEDSQYAIFTYRYEGQLKYRITEKDGFDAIVEPRTGLTAENANAVIQEMAHIARWERTLKLEKGHYPIIKPGDIDMVMLNTEGEEMPIKDGQIVLEQKKMPDGSWQFPSFILKVELKNKEQVPLFCAVSHLSANYGVQSNLLPLDSHLGKKDFTDGGQQVKWQDWEVYVGAQFGADHEKGIAYTMHVPDSYIQRGILELEDHFQLIASTEQFDPLNLYLNGLDDPTSSRPFNPEPKPPSPLDLLLKEVNSRHGGFDTSVMPKKTKVSDWYTTRFTVKTRVVGGE